MSFDSSKQEVINFDSSVVMHELILAVNCDLYGCLCSLGSQLNVLGRLSWSPAALTPNLMAL